MLRASEGANTSKRVSAHLGERTHLNTLDATHGLNHVVEKLPTFILNEWRKKVLSYKQHSFQAFPPFSYFTQFLKDVTKNQSDTDVPKINYSAHTWDKTRPSHQPGTTARVCATRTSDRPMPQTSRSETKPSIYHERPGHVLVDSKAFTKKANSGEDRLLEKKGSLF